MRKLIFLLVGFVLPVFLMAQEEEGPDYLMWETAIMTPDYTKLAEFSAAMAHHNKTYHNEDPYRASVHRIVSGPNIGKLMYIMGPCTFSDLDHRPSGEGHDSDWANNVMPLIKKMENGEYWRMNLELSNVGPEDGTFPLSRIRFHEVRKGQNFQRINRLLKQVSETIKSMEGSNPWAVFINEFQQGYTIGRHIATVSYHNSWSELDDDFNFREGFEKVHGENSWNAFLDDWEDVFSNSWDEFWERSDAMSADPPGNE